MEQTLCVHWSKGGCVMTITDIDIETFKGTIKETYMMMIKDLKLLSLNKMVISIQNIIE